MDSQVEVLHAGPRDHIVLFYRDDSELIGKVGEYLLEALRDGGAAIVFGSWPHRLSLGRLLARAGIDLTTARASGFYQEHDADDMIDRLVIADRVDPASFWTDITPVIRRAAELGRPVRIFGEMVALLWDAGMASAAVEVEAMWNELAAQFPFSLVCAYPLESVTDEGLTDSLTEVCRAHCAVAGDPPPSMRAWRY